MAEQFRLPSSYLDDDESPPSAPSAPFTPDPGMWSGFDFKPSASKTKSTPVEEKEFRLPSSYDDPDPSTLKTLATSPFVGFNRMAAESAGTPVDIATGALNAVGGLNYFVPGSSKPMWEVKHPVFGSEFNKKALGVIGANPDDQPPRTWQEKLGQGLGGGAAGVLVPELMARPLISKLSRGVPSTFTSPEAAARIKASATPAAEFIENAFGGARSISGSATNALIGGVGGVTGEGASELVPEKYAGLARSLGTMAGALPAAATAHGANAIKDAVASRVRQFFEPMSEAGQFEAAKRQFQLLFDNRLVGPAERREPEAANRLQEAVDVNGPGQPVTDASGARLTSGQIAADPKALGVERSVAENTEGFTRNQYGTGTEQQNQARTATAENLQPTGSPTSVPNFLNDAYRQIDAQREAAHNAAIQEAQRQGSGVGQGIGPQDTGRNLRNQLRAADRAADANREHLYDIIDPNNEVDLVATPAVQRARDIRESLPRRAKPITGEESDIYDAAEDLGSVAPFNEMRALRARTNAEMRVQGEGTPPYQRLNRLLNAIDDTMNNAAAHRAAQDEAAAARGEMPPEETMGARLQRDADEFQARRREAEARGSAGAGTAEAGSVGSSTVPPANRGEVPGGGGPGNPAGDQGVQGPRVRTFDDAATERLRAANAATREQKEAFDQGPVGDVLATQGTRENFTLPESMVPGKLLKAGPAGQAAAEAYRRAVQGDPVAMQAFHDAAAESLRREAMDEHGIITPEGFNRWAEQHADMISTLPPQLRQRFQSAAAAGQAVADAAAARLQAQDAYREGIVGRVMGVSDPHDVTKTISGIFNQRDAVEQMTRLRNALNNDPDAVAGLRRSVLDSLLNKVSTNKEVGLSGIDGINLTAYKKMLNEKRAVLGAAGFSDQEINTLQAVANSMEIAQRRNTAQKQPGAAAKLIEHVKQQGGQKETLLNKLEKTKLIGAPVVIGKHLINKMRDTGLTNIQQMQLRGLQDPEFGLQLLQPTPKVPGTGSDIKFGKLLDRMSQFAGQRYYRATPEVPEPLNEDDSVPTRASGGRVNTRDYPAKKASHIEKQMNRICKAYGGELNPMLHADDNAVARAMQVANRGRFADGGRIAPPEEGTVEGPTLNPFGVDPDQIRQITGLKPQGVLPGPLGLFGADTAKNIVEGTANAATLPGDVYQGRVDLGSDEGLGRVINMAGTLASTGLPMAEPGAAGIFGGKLTHDPAGFAKLGEGKDMLTAGVNPRDTYLQSGAWKGPEGMMRYEIPDYNATLKTGAEAAIRTGKNFAGPLKDFVDHPEFFKAYPDLANTTVLFDPSKTSHNGYFAPGSNLIKLYGHEPSQVQSVLLHEMQHAVQNKEGFTPGWSPESAKGEALQLAERAAKAGMPRQTINEKLWSKFDPYDAYRRAAGEIEARAVQRRAELTPEQASIFSPDLDMTAQYPRPKWIVRTPR